MKKALKWIGILLGGLVVLVLVVAVTGYFLGRSKLTRAYEYSPEPITVPSGAEAEARGQYLVEHWMLCADCHGPGLGGGEFIDDPMLGVLDAPNLTPGEGGIGSSYTDEDWVRALRHGIRPNGEVLVIMPAQEYTHVDADELGEIIAYLKSLPPVDNTIRARALGSIAMVLLGLGVIPETDLLPASVIDHEGSPLEAPPRAVTIEYGEYRALTCKGCHGPDFAGIPADPQSGSPDAPNLTPGGEMLTWTEQDFITTLQTGVTPSGHELDPVAMPWPGIGTADEDELQALWLYLSSLPALPTNQ
jgi:mono/diheme cytochrome c family protein